MAELSTPSPTKSTWEGVQTPLPSESFPLLIELLDPVGLAVLRRSSRLEGFAYQAHIAELTGLILDMLENTSFPFTHAAYVLGLNGPYYSYDTVADEHYGIPKALPSILCKLFRLCMPGAAFTTIRMQKLAAAANFGGKHRTLAFNLSAPAQELTADLPETPRDGQSSSRAADDTCDSENAQGYALLLSSGCSGGRGELCADIQEPDWQVLGTPARVTRWVPFLRSSWLQLHWPQRGDLYAIMAWCEPSHHRNQLTQRERRRMAATGFYLPEDACDADLACSESDVDHGGGKADISSASAPVSHPVSRVQHLSPEEEKETLRNTINQWFLAAGLEPSSEKSMKETLLTELVVARVLTTFLHFHSECGIVHDDMHVGNIILTMDTGAVKIIDWELARVIGEEELHTLWTEDVGDRAALIGDRGTQCDSLFRGCVCTWPFQVVGGKEGAACNLFGLHKKTSRGVLERLAARMPSLPAAFLGEHAQTVRKMTRGSEL